MLPACAASTAREPLSVAIPSDCAANAGKVSPPANKIGDDARLTAARYAAKLKLANSRLVKRNACEAAIRKRFAKGK
jgi:hypothetical protein